MRISDWSSDVCSSDLWIARETQFGTDAGHIDDRAITALHHMRQRNTTAVENGRQVEIQRPAESSGRIVGGLGRQRDARRVDVNVEAPGIGHDAVRSEEHTSELQSLMRTSYAVSCLKKQLQLDVRATVITRNLKPT